MESYGYRSFVGAYGRGWGWKGAEKAIVDIYWAFIQGVSSASPEDALGTERSWENAVVYGDGWGALGAERSREDAVVDGGQVGIFRC